MKTKHTNILGGVLVLAALVAGIWYAKSGNKPADVSPINITADQPATEQEKAQQTSQPTKGNTMEGVLKASNDSIKGNLMLETNGKTLYIFTSRNYSHLLGKTVIVEYDGTMEDFRLGNIQEK
jgi:hypothetical protein